MKQIETVNCNECMFYKDGACYNVDYFLTAYNAGARGVAHPPYDTDKFCDNMKDCRYGVKKQ